MSHNKTHYQTPVKAVESEINVQTPVKAVESEINVQTPVKAVESIQAAELLTKVHPLASALHVVLTSTDPTDVNQKKEYFVEHFNEVFTVVPAGAFENTIVNVLANNELRHTAQRIIERVSELSTLNAFILKVNEFRAPLANTGYETASTIAFELDQKRKETDDSMIQEAIKARIKTIHKVQDQLESIGKGDLSKSNCMINLAVLA